MAAAEHAHSGTMDEEGYQTADAWLLEKKSDELELVVVEAMD